MDGQIGRFAQADIVTPGGAQGLDRYAYTNNNPINYTDPTGHYTDCSKLPNGQRSACEDANQKETYGQVSEKLGQNISGLEKWSINDLYRLLGWLNRGIKFDISTDPNNAWTADNIKDVVDSLDYAQTFLGSKTDKALGLSNGGGLTFFRQSTGSSTSVGSQGGFAWPWDHKIELTLLSGSNQYAVFTILHELAHFVDYNLGIQQFGNSPGWRKAASWSEPAWWQFWVSPSLGVDKGVVRPYSISGGPGEDFADTFAFMAYPHASTTARGNGALLVAPSKNRQNYFTNNIKGP